MDCYDHAVHATGMYHSGCVRLLKTFTEHTDQEMMDALAAADKAFVSWAARPVEERAKIISRAAQLLIERKSELAKLATLEMGIVRSGHLFCSLASSKAIKVRKNSSLLWARRKRLPLIDRRPVIVLIPIVRPAD